MFEPPRRNQAPPRMQHPASHRGGPHRRQQQHNRTHMQPPYPNGDQHLQAKKRTAWSAPFTNTEGKFDFSRTTHSVDQFVKTFKLVSPYISQIGRFFKT